MTCIVYIFDKASSRQGCMPSFIANVAMQSGSHVSLFRDNCQAAFALTHGLIHAPGDQGGLCLPAQLQQNEPDLPGAHAILDSVFT